ncbi:MAG: hypothetical protein ACI9GW_002375, partial [Halieaceae bacterium]
ASLPEGEFPGYRQLIAFVITINLIIEYKRRRL